MSHEKAIVVSHERSGTHLLINTIAASFGYSQGRIDIDGQGIDWCAPGELHRFLCRFDGKHVQSVFKSHHPFEVFEPCIDALLEQFEVFYIYRDGRDVMTSFWRFLNQLGWDEGPKEDSVSTFMRCAPRGKLERYQMRDFESMVDRWAEHVRGWSERAPSEVVRVSYEDLLSNFDKTVMAKLAPAFGRAPRDDVLAKPSLESPSVMPWRGRAGTWRQFFDEDDERFFEARAGEVMRSLSYHVPRAQGTGRNGREEKNNGN